MLDREKKIAQEKQRLLLDSMYLTTVADQKFLQRGEDAKFREILYELFEISKIVRDSADFGRGEVDGEIKQLELARQRYQKVLAQLQ